MTESGHFLVPTPLHDDTNHFTPTRRVHSHKRSFAISGDFDFLTKPNSISLSTNPDAGIAINNCFSEPNRKFLNSPNPADESIRLTTPTPRFFVSEEPTFTSLFRGVPDAIINLDEVFKTKPKYFKSHRRIESAPSDFELFVNNKSEINLQQAIKEEDDEELDTNKGNDILKSFSSGSLLSPLKTNLNLPQLDDAGENVKSYKFSNSNTKLNHDELSKIHSLKVNRQNQRYDHYTEQISTKIIDIQSQEQSKKDQDPLTLSTQVCINSPDSMTSSISSSSVQFLSPETPVSGNTFHSKCRNQYSSNDCNRNVFAYNYKYNQMRYNKTSDFKEAIFNFESQEYDIFNNISLESNISSPSKNIDLSSSEYVESSERSKAFGQDYIISQKLLLGEPSDETSVQNQSRKDLRIQEKFIKSILPLESKIVSDSVLVLEGNPARADLKRKSKLKSFMTFFSKN